MAVNEVSKALIEEMKGVVLDMFRCASDLDEWIQYLESTLKDGESTYNGILVSQIRGYRECIKTDKRYHSLDAKEDSLWERLCIELQRDDSEEQES